jgi:hypothetical protein
MIGRGSKLYLAKIQDRQQFLEVFGEMPPVLSTLPEPPKKQRVGYNGPRSYVKLARDSRRPSYAWHSTVGDIDTTDAIAVPRQGYVAYVNGKETDGAFALQMAKEMGYERVYGIAKAYYERIRKELGLPDLTEEAKQYTQEEIDKLDEFTIACEVHYGSYYDYPSEFFKWIKGLSVACDSFIKLQAASSISVTLGRMRRIFDIPLPEVQDFRSEFQKAYPLLSSINLNNVKKEDVIEYIKLKTI